MMLLQKQGVEGNAHESIDSKIMENDAYQLINSKTPFTPSEEMNALAHSLAIGMVGGGGKIKNLAHAFKLAKKFGGLSNIPAYLRAPFAKTKGFRKVGMTEGRATPNDPLFKALERFDSKGEKIPPKRMLDFLIDK